MENKFSTPAVLLLEDGTVFNGFAAGKIGTTTGEICFNTGMTGYQEIFTDPSYYKQIIVMTNIFIGNYGVKDIDTESESMKIAGLVCKNWVPQYSRSMADGNIQSYFEDNAMVGIQGVDTRAIVRHIRNAGAMNAIISSETTDIAVLKAKLAQEPSMNGLELSSLVSTKEAYTFGDENAPFKVAVMDFGVKRNILKSLADRGCYLKVYPAKTNFSELTAFHPDGYFVSNGPGDPSAMPYAVETVKQMLDSNKPLFGICLGHQLLAQANGIPTYKMHNGHRGINHPVKNMQTGLCEITSQNHGFSVDADAVSQNELLEITHVNLNDDTVEGIRVKNRPAFSVQYHPESNPGPHDSRYLFDQFIDLLKSSKA
ncbi:MAG: glutamine-hydrolyzing carbamoyl-phosphate synthase small subunit [Chitinophagales bacterium]|nr:glutamine-hydrolyzing carbamoyl-phosphate synthase small subunit [Chitinophagales bacterium]